ncbi:MMPL family transporter [Jatrophihabitans telluris]|uniref:MMPL family transporter n=1 Tax=Jatrophihabitans telluris TaxID=2038343 RepID=A0ABY4R1H4_9ACTN|nr:MMPL family transporter [Jatrophihabitans telluris]UQX89771.1 MMPL family transporter [Jatrophihabitans telluris]
MATNSATVRLARWSARHPWRALFSWVTLVLVCFLAGGAVGTRQPSDHQLGTGQSGRAADWIRQAGLTDPTTENVLITARSGPLDLPSARRAALRIQQGMTALPEVATVADPVLSADHTALLVSVDMSGSPDNATNRVAALQAVTSQVQRGSPRLVVAETGGASIDAGVNRQLGHDFGQASRISLPITVAILAVAFGAVVAAGLPVILALCAVFAAIGLSALTSHLIPSTDTINEVILLMGLAVGVDYSLFYLKREREERARGLDRLSAIEVAAQTSGRAVVVSGVAVIVSMAGLFLAADVSFASLATGSIIVVAVSVLGSLTVLPALLAKFGRAVDRPRVPLVWRLTNRRQGEPRLWPALLSPALRRPGFTLTVVVAALALLAQPALHLTLRASSSAQLPRTIPAMQTYDRLTAAFPNKNTSIAIVVQAPSQYAGQVRATLNSLAPASGAPLLSRASVDSLRTSTDRRTQVLQLAVPYPSSSDGASRVVRLLRSQVLPRALADLPAARFAVGGDVASDLDFAEHAQQKLPWVMGFVLVLTLLMMTITFRSLVVALTAIGVNLLSAGSAFGILVLVFQQHWAESILGFTSNGAVVAWIPMFLFVVLFGLSMDYHVLVVSRIREGVRNGLSTQDAVREGITRSAGVITSAAVVMVSVFAVFATLSMVEFKQIGVGLSAAVLLDALVIRIVVLPAAMTLLGRANWWPGELSRRPRRSQDGPASTPVSADRFVTSRAL